MHVTRRLALVTLSGPLLAVGYWLVNHGAPGAAWVSLFLAASTPLSIGPFALFELHQDHLRARHPGEPWMLRRDWARGVVRPRDRLGMISLFLLVELVVLTPIGFVASMVDTAGLPVGLAGLAVGAGCAAAALPILAMVRSLSDWSLHLLDRRLVPGEHFRAALKGDLPPGKVTVALECRATRSFGESQHTEVLERWEFEAEPLASNATTLPIGFVAPPGPSTASQHPAGVVEWVIGVRAADGTLAEFEVPCFEAGRAP